MKSKAAKTIFLLTWIFIFYQVLANPAFKEALFEFLKAHPYAAPVLLVAVQSLLAALLLPCSPLTVMAGLLWGVWAGLVYSTLATLAASLVTFLLGRYAVRGWLTRRMAGGWARQTLALIERFGWKASAVAHANPVFPGSSLGYAFGASAIPLPAFAVGALVGNLPLQLLMVKTGDLTRDLAEDGISAGVVMVLSLVVLAIVFYRIAAPLLLDAKPPQKNDERGP